LLRSKPAHTVVAVKTCPHCKKAYEEDLIICPYCQRAPSDADFRLSPRDFKRLRRDVLISLLLLFFGSFSIFGIVSYFFLFKSAIDTAKHFVEKRVTAAFKEPKISQVVTRVAEGEAKGILEHRVQPTLNKLQRITEDEAKKTEAFAKSFRGEYQAKLDAVEEQLTTLRAYNQVNALAATAQVDGSRDALKQLEAMSADTEIGKAAVGGVLAVKLFYLTASRTHSYHLSDYAETSPPLSQRENDSYTTAELLNFLRSANDFRARAVAARLLADKPTKSVPNALLQAVHADSHLEVVRSAKVSFERITGFKEADALDSDELDEWWPSHSDSILKGLAEDLK
jgi:hypothetical protein